MATTKKKATKSRKKGGSPKPAGAEVKIELEGKNAAKGDIEGKGKEELKGDLDQSEDLANAGSDREVEALEEDQGVHEEPVEGDPEADAEVRAALEAKSEVPVVGGELDSYCSHCKRSTLHTVVSMLREVPAKVLCKVCDARHQYNPIIVKESRKKHGRILPKTRALWEEALSSVDSKVLPYDATLTYQVEQVVDHPHFGKGVIVRTYEQFKMEVLFEDQVRRLVHNRST